MAQTVVGPMSESARSASRQRVHVPFVAYGAAYGAAYGEHEALNSEPGVHPVTTPSPYDWVPKETAPWAAGESKAALAASSGEGPRTAAGGCVLSGERVRGKWLTTWRRGARRWRREAVGVGGAQGREEGMVGTVGLAPGLLPSAF